MVNRHENAFVTVRFNLCLVNKPFKFRSGGVQEYMLDSRVDIPVVQPNRLIDSTDDGESSGVVVHTRDHLAPPPMYKVLLHNDDFTPMDFVVSILMAVFHMQSTQANEVMLDVHHKGIGLCGIYPFDIAETKVSQVQQEAKANEFPLKCTYEAE